MSAAPGCAKITVSTFLKHPCSCNNRFIRQHAARLASAQSGSPRLNGGKFATGTQLQNSASNGHKCSAFFKFGKSKDEYKGRLNVLQAALVEPLLLTYTMVLSSGLSHSIPVFCLLKS